MGSGFEARYHAFGSRVDGHTERGKLDVQRASPSISVYSARVVPTLSTDGRVWLN